MARYNGKDAVKRFAARLPVRAEQAKRLIGFAIWNGVTVRTPVDTGRARASWNMNVGSPDLSVAPEPPPGGSVQARGVPVVGAIPDGQPLIISNNLPYIVPLNNGHSAQAPTGFVQATVREVLGQVDAIARQVRLDDEGRS